MRATTLATTAFLALLLVAATAGAQGPPVPDRGGEVALRTGVGIPFGDTQQNQAFDTYVSSIIPFLLEAGFRVDASLFFGVRGSYAFANVRNPNGNCTNASCDGSDVTLGIEGIYRIKPYDTFAPWLGFGGGYEWANYSASSTVLNAGVDVTLSGWQGLLMAGGDYRLNEKFVIGPALEWAFGRFDSVETQTRLGNSVTTTNGDIANRTWHHWLTLGIRGAFGF